MTGRPIEVGDQDLLLAVDVQNDFCPDGALAVPGGDEVVPVINRLGRVFSHVALTQDWHQSDHLSFASSHPGANPFEQITLPYGAQVLWPDHCVQGSAGAQFHRDLDLPQAELIIRKGFDPAIDSYSAFRENDRRTRTGLAGYLRERGIARLFIAGLALDFCVRYSAEDAKTEGFEIIVISDACRAIDIAGSLGDARQSFKALGIPLISANRIHG
jgi:nicotinamidase/pyrazinamidase